MAINLLALVTKIPALVNLVKSIKKPKLKDSLKDGKTTGLAAIPAIFATSVISGEVTTGDPLQDILMTIASSLVTLGLLIYRKHEDESNKESN